MLQSWGLGPYFIDQISESDRNSYTLGRITNEEKGAYKVITEKGFRTAQISGRYEFRCADEKDLPTVGDWVLCFGADVLLIDRLLNRSTTLARRKAGSEDRSQLIAVNLDFVLIITSLNMDLNIRRLERYLALAINGGIKPIIVLSKADLADGSNASQALQHALYGIDSYVVSAVTGTNMHALQELFSSGKTGALVGSSGVGKSTLLNFLLGEERQTVQNIRNEDDRGRHTTTSRSMFQLPGGGVLIDMPGIKEVGMTEDDTGVQDIFRDLDSIVIQCRFSNCSHVAEPGCEILAMVDAGTLDVERIKSWQKLKREQLRHEAARDARLMTEIKKERKHSARRIRAGNQKGIW